MLCATLAWQRQLAGESGDNADAIAPPATSEPRVKIEIESMQDDDDIFDSSPTDAAMLEADPCASCQVSMKPANQQKGPRIFFTSRTHVQIAQLVSELRKAVAYRPMMTLLASRDHYCLNAEVISKPNTKEECARLVEKKMCVYHKNVRAFSNARVMGPGTVREIWDLEDLKDVAKDFRGVLAGMSSFAANHWHVVL